MNESEVESEGGRGVGVRSELTVSLIVQVYLSDIFVVHITMCIVVLLLSLQSNVSCLLVHIL